MVDRPDPTCLPIEMELLPLHREPPGLARALRRHKRDVRRAKRAGGRERLPIRQRLSSWASRPR